MNGKGARVVKMRSRLVACEKMASLNDQWVNVHERKMRQARERKIRGGSE